MDQELVQVTALQVVFDLLQKFGLEAFKLNPDQEILDQDSSAVDTETEKETGGEEGEEQEGEMEEEEERESSGADNTATSVLTILTGLLESEVGLLITGRVSSAIFSR